MTTQTTLPDIERCALTILAQAEASHPVLRDWVRAITANPDEQRMLDSYPIAAEYQDDTARARLAYRLPAPGGSLSDLINDDDAIDRDHAYAPRDPRFVSARMEAVRRLATRVVLFRRAGRPEGDVTAPLMGMGSPLAYVTTSLAAAVAEYVHDLNGAWATRLMDAEEA